MKNKTRRPLSIKWKLFTYLCLFAAALILVLWLLQVVFLESFYKAYKTREIRRMAGVVADNIDNGEIGALLRQIGGQQGISVVIADPDGMEVLRMQEGMRPDPDLGGAQTLQQVYEAAVENGGSYVRQQALQDPQALGGPFRGWRPDWGRFRKETLLCARVVDSQQGERLIVLTSEITPVGSTVEALRAELLCISAFLLLLSLGLALLISRKVSAPIIRINDAAKQLGQGRFDVAFEGGGYREADELSATLGDAARQLGRQDDLRRELLANVSHDLRTPLTMIIGYAEVIRDLPGENTPENVQVIIDEASRLNDLVTDLLDLSKLQAQVKPLERQVFCLTDSVRDTLQRLRKLTGAAGCRIEFEQQGDVYVCADELRLSQVVYNLVGNAIAHTGADGRVTVRQLCRGEWVHIEVTDTGAGIPQGEQALIWERYYKKSETNHRPGSGTGLGLAIAKAVLEQHGARFGVESEPGRGSTFWFALPAASPLDTGGAPGMG